MAPKVLIVGTGFGGLALALELKRAGYQDFVLLEQADEVGGVWRDNTYPGAGCDIPSPYYSYSFAPNRSWPARFARQRDILAYIRRIVDEYDLRRHIHFGVEVTAAAFDERRAVWQIDTEDGDLYEADVFVPAVGQLSRPSIPAIPGRDRFGGKAFHSARWNHGIDLSGKRVAVIGTGASAIQFVPEIAPKALQLTVFQRSAPWVTNRPDARYGVLHRLLAPALQRVERFGWWAFFEYSTLGLLGNQAVVRSLVGLPKWQLRRQVPDPVLRAKLTPTDSPGCRRALFSDDWYPALGRANVHVETERITEFTRSGIRTADGVEHRFDVVIYATGFAAQDFLGPIEVTGSGGADLREFWAEGARAYLGLAVPDFPNMFLMYGPNTNLGAGSIIFMHECQARYIRGVVEHLGAHPGTALAVRPAAEQRYDAEIQRRLAKSVWITCDSWYRAASGRVSTNWPGLVSEYRRRTRRVDLADYRTVTATSSEKA
ncbi:flavin-containing monooxygenase [Nocardia stercoris]|uniref:NAD(P)/FAD-dependent oxidoreductase n=1 Tax=Nocardia stercoris TaxID=2483361 RepID=A0A3M2L9W5_9NOCA|nr:NAD(P)/FAD-dependent oxidoreductase [Nocardia stercoris]RMI31368.1 NAD(P)/FAD-dependent oxidoreductase [Nocardia stercoris]